MNDITGVPASPSGCQPTASAAVASSQSGIPNAALVTLLRALAHDCEATDGWEDAAQTVHSAADRLLTLETRMSDMRQWADNSRDNKRDAANDDDEWACGWEAGYAAAASMAFIIADRDNNASAIEARSDATGTGAAEGESAGPKADAQEES